MNKLLSIPVFAIVYSIFLLIIGGYAFWGVPLRGIHVGYRLEFILLTFVTVFIDFWLLIHTFALFAGYSTRKEHIKNKTVENKRANRQKGLSQQLPFIITHMIIFIAYIVLLTLVLPTMHQRILSIRAVSTTLRNFIEEAQISMAAGDSDSAIMYLEEYNTYIDTDGEVKSLLNAAYAKRSDRTNQKAVASTDPDAQIDGYSLKELIQLSEEYLEKEDYIAANYYASQAQRLSTTERFDVAQLLQRSIEGMRDTSRHAAEREDWERYRRTVDGYQDYINGINGNVAALVRAYFAFSDLLAEYPTDTDITLYYNRSRAKILQLSFFEQELDIAKNYPAEYNSVFLNQSGADYYEVVYIDTIYAMQSKYYATGIEVIRFLDDGTIQEHFVAPAAKVYGNSLNFRMLQYDRNISPLQIITGTQKKNDDLLYLMPLVAPIQELLMSNRAEELISSVDVIELLNFANTVKERSPKLWSVSLAELSKKILKGVGILFFAMLFVTLAIHVRENNNISKGLGKSFLFLPIVIVLLYILQQVYLYIGYILLFSTALVFGNGVAITLLIVMISGLLLYTLIKFSTLVTPLRD